MSEKEKTFTPCKLGQIVPFFGFLYRVIEADPRFVKLEVCGISKSGRKLGYVVHEKIDDPLALEEEKILQEV